MKKTCIPIYLLIMVSILLHCTPRQVHDREEQTQRSSDSLALNNQLNEIELLCENLVLDHYLAYFYEDAMLLPPGQAPIKGIEAIREYLSGFYDFFIPSFECQYSERKIEVEDSLAVRQYKSFGRILYLNAKDTLISDNKYMELVKKQSDGSWKIVWQMWNANKPIQ